LLKATNELGALSLELVAFISVQERTGQLNDDADRGRFSGKCLGAGAESNRRHSCVLGYASARELIVTSTDRHSKVDRAPQDAKEGGLGTCRHSQKWNKAIPFLGIL
jgi:hypothetical protein